VFVGDRFAKRIYCKYQKSKALFQREFFCVLQVSFYEQMISFREAVTYKHIQEKDLSSAKPAKSILLIRNL
jgi:hypothetical protein